MHTWEHKSWWYAISWTEIGKTNINYVVNQTDTQSQRDGWPTWNIYITQNISQRNLTQDTTKVFLSKRYFELVSKWRKGLTYVNGKRSEGCCSSFIRFSHSIWQEPDDEAAVDDTKTPNLGPQSNGNHCIVSNRGEIHSFNGFNVENILESIALYPIHTYKYNLSKYNKK